MVYESATDQEKISQHAREAACARSSHIAVERAHEHLPLSRVMSDSVAAGDNAHRHEAKLEQLRRKCRNPQSVGERTVAYCRVIYCEVVGVSQTTNSPYAEVHTCSLKKHLSTASHTRFERSDNCLYASCACSRQHVRGVCEMRMQRLQKAVPCNSPLLSEALARLERSEFRLCMLTAANKAFASTLDVDACIDGIVRLIVPKLSSWCILDIGGGSAAFARTGVFQANDGGPVKVDLNSSSPAGTSWQPLFDILRTALPKRCAQPLGPSLLQHAREIKQQPIVNESGLGAIIVLPIDFCGSRQGTLMLAAGGSRCSYTLDDVELALALVALMNNALERAVLSQSAAVESAERRRAETRFQRLLEAAPDAMVIAGPDGEILVVNSQTEALFGFERRELIGQQIEILLPPALRPDYALRLAEYLAQAET